MENKNKKIDHKDLLKEYFKFASKYKLLFSSMIIAVVLTEGLFVVDKFLYKRLIDDAEKFISGTLTQSIFVETILIIAVIFLGIIIFRTFFKWLSTYLVAIFEPKIIYDVKNKYFNHIIRLHHKFHANHKSGSLISKLGRGQRSIESLTDIFVFQIGPLILQLALVGVSIAFFSGITTIILFAIVVVFVSYSLYINRLQIDSRKKMNKSNDRESGFVSDTLTNIESIKYHGKENTITSIMKRLFSITRTNSQKAWGYFSYLESGQTLVLGIGTIALLFFPFKEFLAGNLSLGTIVFIYSLYGNVASSLVKFVWGIRSYYRAMTDMQGLFEYGKMQNEIKDKPNAKNIKITLGEVEFRNISFTYREKKGKGKKIFEKFNLKIKANEKVALVGHSGSGKTTIVKLLNRFYDIDSGSILVDKKNIKDFKQENLRSETGIVPQEAILFDDTIYNNIKFSSPYSSRNEVLRAIHLAQLDGIIKRLPNGIKTIVGERGIKLSGGEKQRVSIARAILADKKILILDEATSALDSHTEAEIQKALDKLLEGRTSIIIAHRLSTIMKADKIVVLDNGKIIESGNHKELIKNNGAYSKLWGLQSGGYIQD